MRSALVDRLPPSRRLWLHLCCSCALLSSVELRAQQRTPLELPRLSSPIVVDGVPDDSAWQRVSALPLTLYTPTFRGTPTQRTEIRVAYDDENLYAAGWFFDTDASSIRINSLYRDRWTGDDAFGIHVDAFHDNQNAKWFGVTAGGVRFDQLISDDGATLNANWDTFWTAKTAVTDSGWFVEVRIPFSSLGFRADSAGIAHMGLTLSRLIGRSDERVTFPAIEPRFEFRRPSQAQDVVLHNVKSRTPVYVTPYTLGSFAQSPSTCTVSRCMTARDGSKSAGVDLRYPLSSNLTLDLTVNTDFAQVEADDQQINLDRFPLFFPERRRFFQENSGNFDFVLGGNTRLFNSRRIGLAADFSPLQVYGGARLVGRAGNYDLGVLEMQTRADGTTPSENFGVLRMRRKVLNPLSTAGFMVTSYSGGARRNVAVGSDGVFQVSGDNYLTLKYAATTDTEDPHAAALASRSVFDLKWERRTQRGLQYALSGTRAGRDFRPEIGFQQRRDFTTANFVGNYFIFTDRNKVLRRIYPGALAFSTYRNQDGALESGQYALWVQWDTKAGGTGWIEPKLFHENVLADFSIGRRSHIPAGSYDFADVQVALTMASGRRVRTSVDFRSGSYFDGSRTQVILAPTWNVSRNLEVGGDYQLSHLRFARRKEFEDIQLARLRVRLALDAQRSGNAFLQYNSTTRRMDVNVRLRYAFSEGTDIWIVYNEGLDTDRTAPATGLQRPLSLARAVIVKYSRTFAL